MFLSVVRAHLHAVLILLRTTFHPSIWNAASWEELDRSATLIFRRAPSGSDWRKETGSFW
jgi:hypothetical protein